MEKIETRIAFIWLHEKNMVWEDIKRNAEITEDDIRENTAAALKLTGGARYTAVLDARGKDATLTDGAMKYGASQGVIKHRIATAHVTTSLSGRLIGNFFMKFFKPKINNRMFANPEDAVKWLRTFSE